MGGTKGFAIILGLVTFLCADQVASQTSWTITKELDSAGRYNVTRWVDIEKNLVEFEVKARTNGFVGFGVSYTGGMVGADIVIGGVNDTDGTPYFHDRHANATALPAIDEKQNWHLIFASQNGGITTLRFNRTLNTCDEDDIPFTDDTLKMIWAIGEIDTLGYHGQFNKGAASVNMLDPPQPNPDLSGLKEWPVLKNDTMPSVDTAYWCSIHTTPQQIVNKTYLVGFEATLLGEYAELHTHHFIFSKCVANTDEARRILKDNVGKPGRNCNTGDADNPRQFCNMYMFVWAKGGERTNFPKDVGFPIAETPGEVEYFMLEIHYDNPEKVEGLNFTTGLTIFYDDKRTIEAGLLVIGHEVWFPHTIPPNSKNFMTLGHCPSECTAAFMKQDINVFNVLLHSHLSGRRLKVRHIRDGKELPWASNDDNYDFNYQQNRPLRQNLIVKPGDHLIYECITDTDWRNGSVTIGDLATTDEMCEAFLMYYPRMEMDNCLSTVDTEIIFPVLGIKNVTENKENGNNPIITAPDYMKGLTYTQALEQKVNWTKQLRDEFQRAVRFEEQYYFCGKGGGLPEDLLIGQVKYPSIDKEYVPPNPCTRQETGSGMKTVFFGNVILSFGLTLVLSMIS